VGTLPVDYDIDDHSTKFDEPKKERQIDFRPSNFKDMTEEDRDIFDYY